MFQMFTHSIKLFLQGKLFRDGTQVFMQWLKGFALTLVVLLVVGVFANVWLAVVLASLAGGIVQPYLFKDLKYR